MRNMLRPLFEAGAHVRCVAHFNEPPTINSEYSGESNLPITRSGLRWLSLDALLIEQQEESRLPRGAVDSINRLPPGPRVTPRPTMINLLSQLYSLKQVWRLAHLTPDDYDVFLFLRPDLEYLDRLRPEQLFEQILTGKADLVTPSWQQWGGLNDRFAFCSRKGAEAFANRIDMVERFCAEEEMLHAETLLSRLVQWSDLRLRYTNLRAMRVRADGSTYRERFDLNPMTVARGIVRKRIEKVRVILGKQPSSSKRGQVAR